MIKPILFCARRRAQLAPLGQRACELLYAAAEAGDETVFTSIYEALFNASTYATVDNDKMFDDGLTEMREVIATQSKRYPGTPVVPLSEEQANEKATDESLAMVWRLALNGLVPPVLWPRTMTFLMYANYEPPHRDELVFSITDGCQAPIKIPRPWAERDAEDDDLPCSFLSGWRFTRGGK